MTATATPASEQRAAQIRDFRRYGWIRVEGLLGDVDGPLGVPIGRHALRAGDALVWQAMTMHHAPSNTSTLRRRAYQRTYISDEVRYTGQPAVQTDGLGLQLGDPLERDRFPLL